MYRMRIFILVGRERERGGEGGRDRWMDGTERWRSKKKRGWMDRLWMDGWMDRWMDMEIDG